LGTIEAAGGGVDVESTRGEGATFHLYLPVAQDAGAKAQRERPHTEGIQEGTSDPLE
jgi:hypothetical protein